MQKKQESLKAAAAASGAGKVLFREMPRPKLSHETVEELATSVAKRKTVRPSTLNLTTSVAKRMTAHTIPQTLNSRSLEPELFGFQRPILDPRPITFE